jgi:hypothetical protein
MQTVMISCHQQSRKLGIAVTKRTKLFSSVTDYHAMKADGEVEAYLHVFLSSALHRDYVKVYWQRIDGSANTELTLHKSGKCFMGDRPWGPLSL